MAARLAPSALPWLTAIPGVLGLEAASPQSPPTPPPPCVGVPQFPLLVRTEVTAIRGPPRSTWPHPNLVTSAKTCLWVKSRSQEPRVRTWTYFGGAHSTPYTPFERQRNQGSESPGNSPRPCGELVAQPGPSLAHGPCLSRQPSFPAPHVSPQPVPRVLADGRGAEALLRHRLFHLGPVLGFPPACFLPHFAPPGG